MENTRSRTKTTLIFLWIVTAIMIIASLFFYSTSYAKESFYDDNFTSLERETAKEMEDKYITSSKVYRFSGDVEIEEDETIKGDIVVGKGTLIVNGKITGTVLALYGDVELGHRSYVEGDVISVDGLVWSKEGAYVAGDIVETGNNYKQRRQKYRETQNVDREDLEREIEQKVQEEIAKQKEYQAQEQAEREELKAEIKEEVQAELEEKLREEMEEEKEEEPAKPRKRYVYRDSNNESMYGDYNRVDGLTLGFQFPDEGWWERRNNSFAILGNAGYSFASKNPHYSIGLQRGVHLYLGAEMYDQTASEDDWLIDDTEHFLAAILMKEDFKDYYRKEGFSVYGGQNISSFLKIRAEYHEDKISSLEKNTNWSVFGSKKKFRENPMALPYGAYKNVNFEENGALEDVALNLKTVSATVTLDTRNRLEETTRGWYIQAFGEKAGYELEGDMSFERYIVDIRRFQPLGWDENINIRLRAGTTRGDVPPLYWFDLGGISTLRGFNFKEFTGDRMVLGNIEYRLNTGGSDWFLLDDFDVILFADTGYAWFADEDIHGRMTSWETPEGEEETGIKDQQTDPVDTFEGLSWSSMKTNVGIALASPSDGFRVNFAKRTDVGGSDFVVTFRIKQAF